MQRPCFSFIRQRENAKRTDRTRDGEELAAAPRSADEHVDRELESQVLPMPPRRVRVRVRVFNSYVQDFFSFSYLADERERAVRLQDAKMQPPLLFPLFAAAVNARRSAA
mgnify:CR=1 FL=1